MDINDYQNCVNEMRRCLATETINESVVEEANNQFSEAIREVNSRLRECEKMLRQHQVIEAIRQADLEPSLLDAVEILDIAEIDLWNALLQSFDLGAGEPLCHGPAEDLNASYSELQPLEEDLRRHRLLAIAQSPLRLRLKTLRKLNLLDPDNRIWSEDLESFEGERSKQIQAELQNAIKQKNIPQIEDLLTEIKQTDWITPPPAKWSGAGLGAVKKIKRQQAYKLLNSVTLDLENAWQEQGFPDPAVEIGERWYELRHECDLANDDPLVIRAEPALDWLEEKNEAAQIKEAAVNAIATIDTLLTRVEGTQELAKKKQVRIEIQKLLARVDRSDHEIPAILRARIATFHDNLDKSARQKFVLRLGAVAATVVLGLAGVLWLINSLGADARKKDLVESVRQPFVKQRWTDASHAWTSLPEEIQSLSSVRKMKGEIDRQLNQEKKEKKEAEKQVEKASQLYDQAIQAFNNAESQVASSEISARKTAREKLEDVRRLLATIEIDSNENAGKKLKSIRDEIGKLIEKNNVAIDSRLQEKLDFFRDEYQKLAEKKLDPIKQNTGYKSLADQVRDAKNLYEGIASLELVDSMEPLENKISGHLKKLGDYREYRDELQGLQNRLFSSSAYQKSLQEIINDYPDYASELQMIVDHDLPVWVIADTHNRIIEQAGNFPSRSSDGLAANALPALIQKINEFQVSYPEFNVEELQSASEYLAAIGARSSLELGLSSKLSKKIFKEGKVLEVDGKEKYFVSGISKLSAGGVKARVLRDLEGRVGNKLLEDADNSGTDRYVLEEANYAALVAAILQNIQNMRSSTAEWEDSVWQLVQIIYKEKGVNKIIKHMLLVDVLGMGEKGSVSFASTVRTIPPALRGPSGEPGHSSNIDFFDESRLKDADEKLQKLKKTVRLIFKQEKEIRAKHKLEGGNRYVVVGLMHENADGAWEVLSNSKGLAIDGQLYVPRGDGASATLLPIGSVTAGDFRLDTSPSKTQHFILGRPVFIKDANKKS